MGYVRHIAHMGKMRKAYTILVGRPEKKRPWETSIYGMMTLKWILKNRV
jgi:hypothetical protein